MRDDHERLRHILEAILRIEKYAARGRDIFERDELIQSWMIHHIQIIGEAVRAISFRFKEMHPEIPWSEIVGMRHILVHDYFGIDLDIVWRVIEDDLPELKSKIRSILGQAGL